MSNNSLAYEFTPEDVQRVLTEYYPFLLDYIDEINDLLFNLYSDKITDDALYGIDLGEQTKYANESIRKYIQEFCNDKYIIKASAVGNIDHGKNPSKVIFEHSCYPTG